MLFQKTLDSLINNVNGKYVDCTFGQGGHSRGILSRLSTKGALASFDLDELAEIEAKKIKNPNFSFHKTNFKNITDYFSDNELDGILIDCGVSSPQIDEPSRGFSFMKDGPLDMRFGKEAEVSCENIINDYAYEDLERIFKEYGEEIESKRIAKEIVTKREQNRIVSTKQLSSIIEDIKKIKTKKNPATKVFQALRIEVNKELDNLRICLDSAKRLLRKNGRLVVISFHSLEDRIVKNCFKTEERLHEKDLPLFSEQVQKKKFSVSNVITPEKHELTLNIRARSAKMRVVTKL